MKKVFKGSKQPSDSKKLNGVRHKNGTAHIGALLTLNKSYSTLRLMKDYNEIKNQKNPLLGVTAHPLDDSMFVWHGNIKALGDNVFKGAILHLDIRFSDYYPKVAPKIKVLNKNLKHSSILPDGSICLEMLDKTNGEPYKGWTPAYSILSILIQLQNFFFDVDLTTYSEEEIKKIPNTVRTLNEFNCKCCGHKGSASPKPDFPKSEEVDMSYKMSKDEFRENIKNEISCIMRKNTFEEGPLGFGISIVRIPRTGDIKGITIVPEYLSLKAFQKQRIRTVGFSNTNFTHWLPLYFGVNEKQFIHLSQRALSMICTGNTRNFAPEHILKAYPKIFTYLVTEISGEKLAMSSKALNTLIHVYRGFRLLLDTFPQAQETLESHVSKFITDPTYRLKENTNSLGDLLTYSVMTTKNSFKELLPFYIDESMDRSIFWMLKLLPELEELIDSSEIDDVRAKVCFKAGIVGHQILLVYNYLNNKILFKDSLSNDDIKKKLDEDFGCLTENEVFLHQKNIKQILKVEAFSKYYELLGLPSPNEKEMNLKLKQAHQNSLAKKYHGDIDEVRFVPEEKEQITMLLNKYTPVNDLTKEGKLLPENDPIWEKLVSKFDTYKKMKFQDPAKHISTIDFVLEYEKENLDTVFHTKPTDFSKRTKIYTTFEKITVEDQVEKIENEFLAKLSWRDIYVKVFFEFYVANFRYIVDFVELYSLLDLFQDNLKHFTLIIRSADNLKSDYNYIRAIIGKLTKIKYFKIYFDKNVTVKMIKNIVKGYNNFIKEGGETEYLKVFLDNKFSGYDTQEFNLLSIIDKMPNLKVLDFSNTKLDKSSILRIRNHLYYYKTLQCLKLKNSNLDDNMSKELADGIMKAKCLDYIDLSSNPLNKGLASLLYNLAFQPLLKYLDIKDNKSSDGKELANALYKLIKMSMSLEYLDASGIPSLNGNLNREFFSSLGDNSYLKSLNLSSSGNMKGETFRDFGAAIAFNEQKKGSLVELSLKNTNMQYSNFVDFVENMHISESIHFTWYNSPFNPEITKDKKAYYERFFHCKLRYLDLSNNTFTTAINIFSPKNLSENHLHTFLSKTPTLVDLRLSNTTVNKNFIELIVHSMQNANSIKTLTLNNSKVNGELAKVLADSFGTIEKPNTLCKIENLDLSMNFFGYSGIEAFSKVIKFNKTLKVVNFFHNVFDVNGARRLAEALEENSSIEALNIGYNRIKDLGLITIIDALTKNKQTKLNHLSCKYNFIKTNTFITCFENIVKGATKINELEFCNNNLEEKSLLALYNKYFNESSSDTNSKSNVSLGVPCLNSDVFEILYYIQPEKIERTVWISPINYNENKNTILQAIFDAEAKSIKDLEGRLGIPKFVYIRRGRKTGHKKDCANSIAFVEFIHPNSANMMLKLASTSGFSINGKRMRIFKAGTRTEFIVVKKSKTSDDGFRGRERPARDGRGEARGGPRVRGARGGARAKPRGRGN